MSERPIDAKTWTAGILFLGIAVVVGRSLPDGETSTIVRASAERAQPPTDAPAQAVSFPNDAAIPDGPFGDVIRRGEAIFHDTKANAGTFVGNDLNCSNCHIDRGRKADSAPLWAAYVQYPAYRDKNGHVNTFQERLQGCFSYSMNGKAPETGDDVLVALESYAYFLAKGAPTGTEMPGRGYPKLAKPERFDIAAGEEVYAQNCAVCHGGGGAGQKTADGVTVFPPLWGERSYNWGAGMSSIANAAGFIKANMPLGRGNTLTDQQAWDVAAFIDSRERPQDPRFAGSVAETRAKHHDSPFDLYGQTVDGVVLGEASPPSGTVPAPSGL